MKKQPGSKGLFVRRLHGVLLGDQGAAVLKRHGYLRTLLGLCNTGSDSSRKLGSQVFLKVIERYAQHVFSAGGTVDVP